MKPEYVVVNTDGVEGEEVLDRPKDVKHDWADCSEEGEADGCSLSSCCQADMKFVKKFTQARFLKAKFYPKVRKSQ